MPPFLTRRSRLRPTFPAGSAASQPSAQHIGHFACQTEGRPGQVKLPLCNARSRRAHQVGRFHANCGPFSAHQRAQTPYSIVNNFAAAEPLRPHQIGGCTSTRQELSRLPQAPSPRMRNFPRIIAHNFRRPEPRSGPHEPWACPQPHLTSAPCAPPRVSREHAR